MLIFPMRNTYITLSVYYQSGLLIIKLSILTQTFESHKVTLFVLFLGNLWKKVPALKM